jgi:hypothetical protein
MEKIENGTEVLIFKKNSWENKCDEKNFVRGTIIGCELSHDLSQHGSPWYENIYTVLGEDNNTYKGTYGSWFLGDCSIRTPEDHIAYLKRLISLNYDKIAALNVENSEYRKMISAVEKVKEQIALEEAEALEPMKTDSYSYGEDLKKKREQIRESIEEARREEIEELKGIQQERVQKLAKTLTRKDNNKK